MLSAKCQQSYRGLDLLKVINLIHCQISFADYDPEFPVTSLRLLPAIAGSLLVPLVYQILVLMDLSRWTAALAAVLILCGKCPNSL